MAKKTRPADQTPPVEPAVVEAATVEQPKSERWYKVLCWPTAAGSGKPLVYTGAHASAGSAVNDARERINKSRGENAAEGWTFTVQRTTKPKGSNGGDAEPQPSA
jgi:hypothetical protein